MSDPDRTLHNHRAPLNPAVNCTCTLAHTPLRQGAGTLSEQIGQSKS